MPRIRPKKKVSKAGLDEEGSQKKSESRVRQDLPDETSIVGEKEFISPKGNKYRIILTDETDPYEQPEKSSKKRAKEDS